MIRRTPGSKSARSRRDPRLPARSDLPEGCDAPGWEPADWAAICDDYGWSDSNYGMRTQRGGFRWPRRRLSFPRTAAEKRAAPPRRCGATVPDEAADPGP